MQLTDVPGGSGAFCLPLFLSGACFACSASLCNKQEGLLPKKSKNDTSFSSA